MASPRRCTRIALVEPGVPGGLPATITTTVALLAAAELSIARSTWRTISSVVDTPGTRNVSTPHTRASWLRTSGTGVKASSGIAERYRDSRRAVSPVA